MVSKLNEEGGSFDASTCGVDIGIELLNADHQSIGLSDELGLHSGFDGIN